MISQSGPSTPSTPRSTPGARGDERRARWHAGAIGQPPRTLRSTRAGLFLHDQLRRLAKNATFPAAVKVMIKTLSTDAAARTVPPAIGPDRASPSWARSEQMRSMFSVFVCFFSLVRAPPGCRAGNAKVGVFTLRRLLYDCSARACGPDEPRGDPGGPGGEAQWPDGGSTAWTERASKSPGRVKG
jgi:hypothetical protein